MRLKSVFVNLLGFVFGHDGFHPRIEFVYTVLKIRSSVLKELQSKVQVLGKYLVCLNVV